MSTICTRTSLPRTSQPEKPSKLFTIQMSTSISYILQAWMLNALYLFAVDLKMVNQLTQQMQLVNGVVISVTLLTMLSQVCMNSSEMILNLMYFSGLET